METPVTLVPMTDGREVVEDYRSTGLSLWPHPVSFLREDLRDRSMLTNGSLAVVRDRSWVTMAGIVLMRQRPGSAPGVTLINTEDETDVANLIVWSDVFERQRRLVLSASMIACRGRVQREGEVVHVVAHRLGDLSDLLRSLERRGGGHPERDTQAAGPQLGKDIKLPTRISGSGPGSALAALRVSAGSGHRERKRVSKLLRLISRPSASQPAY